MLHTVFHVHKWLKLLYDNFGILLSFFALLSLPPTNESRSLSLFFFFFSWKSVVPL
jgi:hypothetical protein